MKVGLVPMAGKPVHSGHWCLISLAAAENDAVKVFVSTGDRDDIKGSTMVAIWHMYLTPVLPKNVEPIFVKVPVKSVYDELGRAEENLCMYDYSIYSDVKDISNYRSRSLMKVAPTLCQRIRLRGVERSSTVDISGTEMRSLLRSKRAIDRKKFISFLPVDLRRRGEEIYDMLRS
jgi:hypothetical protein